MILISSCTLNKVIHHHGVHNLEKKQTKLKINYTNKNDMKKINFDKSETVASYTKQSFVYNFLFSLRQKIDDPLGKKRIKGK